MKFVKLVLMAICLYLFHFSAIAQPFTLDKAIKPIKLELREDKEHEGAKGIGTVGIVDDKPVYYYVVGHDIFQFVDVYIYANEGNPKFTVELVNNDWNKAEAVKTSTNEENGIINFQIRTWGDFGIKFLPVSNSVYYSIIVRASPPVRDYMNSPFVKVSQADLKGGANSKMSSDDQETQNQSQPNDTGGIPGYVYVIIILLVVIIGLLAFKVLGKKSTFILLIGIMFINPYPILAQYGNGSGGNTNAPIYPPGDINQSGMGRGTEEYGRGDGESNDGGNENETDNSRVPPSERDRFNAARTRFDEVTGKWQKGLEKLEKVKKGLVSIKDFYDSYQGLSDCISSGTPPGMPKIPSFCETTECGACFKAAREKFNFTRYQFEKLSTIYNCTKSFTEKAIALGDNTSGIHAVSGLAWQSEKGKIEQSFKEHKAAVDKKYTELLNDLQESLMMLDQCEAEHGIADWYDRFGYMYFEFAQMNYKRKD